MLSDAAPGRAFAGHVGFISPTAEFTPKIGRDAGAAHRPRLPPARDRRSSPTRAAAGHAGHPAHPAGERRLSHVRAAGAHRGLDQALRRRRARRSTRSRARSREGAITGLVGPDGAGKTTLIRLMAGLVVADGGSHRGARLRPGAHAERDPRAIGYMPQRFGLYEDLTVAENLAPLRRPARAAARRSAPRGSPQLLAFTDLGASRRGWRASSPAA